MDKELLRIVIIAIGVTVIVIMVLWNVYKNQRPRREIDFYDKGNPLDNIDESLIIKTGNDDFDIDVVPLGSAIDEERVPDPVSEPKKQKKQQQQQQQEQINSIELPKIIQFSIVAVADKGFNGNDLVESFKRVGLEYGSMKIFERVDDQRRVDYAVASMVEPGTFPDTDLESFVSPGIVFFLQPGELDKPLAVFDDFIQTINLLATTLDGVKWDHNRQPLSEETIKSFRTQLMAY